MGKKRINNPNFTLTSGNIKVSEEQIENMAINQGLIFCFCYISEKYNLDKCALESDRKYARGLLREMQKLSKMNWTQLQMSSRKGSGSEKIPRDSVKVSVPKTIAPDVNDFMAFRFAGSDARLIGFRGQDNLFHIVYIDTKLEVYRH